MLCAPTMIATPRASSFHENDDVISSDIFRCAMPRRGCGRSIRAPHEPRRSNCLDDAFLRPLPRFFPKDVIKATFHMHQFNMVIKRLAKACRDNSIQVKYNTNKSISMELNTPEQVEIKITFWASADREKFFVDMQCKRGDSLSANQYIHKLIDTSNGLVDQATYNDESKRTDGPRHGRHQERHDQNSDPRPSKKVKTYKSVNRPLSDAENQTTKVTLQYIFQCLQGPNTQKMGLDILRSMTDLRNTFPSVALFFSMIVLKISGNDDDDGGGGAANDSAKAARLIHDGIDERLVGSIRHELFLALASRGNSNNEHNDKVYSREIFGLAFSIIVNSLEVISLLQKEQKRFAVKNLLLSLKSEYRFDVIEFCKSKMENSDDNLQMACLATKVVRLIGGCFPDLCSVWLNFFEFPLSKGAMLGKEQHAGLFLETKKLHRVLEKGLIEV